MSFRNEAVSRSCRSARVGGKKIESQKKMLQKKMAQYRVPLQQLKINYSVSTTNKKVYTEEEDRFLLVLLDRFGIDSDNLYENIRDEIRDSPLFRFDWFFLSRTPIEISRRCTTLLTTVAREFEDASASKSNGTNGKAVKRELEDEENDEDSVLGAPAKKKSKNGVKVCEASHVCLEMLTQYRTRRSTV